MTVYISAPITGHDINERRAYFESIENKYKAAGYEVMNPLKNGLDDSDSYEDHMRIDILMLVGCTHIHLDEHWKSSKGCQVEFSVAKVCGIEIINND